MTDLLIAYTYLAILVFIIGVVFYMGATLNGLTLSRRAGARLILAAPVWPLAVVLVAVKALLYWVPRIWKDAWS